MSMLNSQKIQPLLLQLLEPCAPLTPLLPLSASLVSTALQKPLLTCVSKAGVELDRAAGVSQGGATEGATEGLAEEGVTATVAVADETEHTPLLTGNEAETLSAKIETLQREIERIDGNYDVDYINANVNPIDNLDIITLMVAKEWATATPTAAWKVYELGKYRLFMGLVSEHYTVLLCTPREYPAAVAVARTVGVCQALAGKI